MGRHHLSRAALFAAGLWLLVSVGFGMQNSAAPLPILRLAKVTFRVNSLAGIPRFYSEVMGFEQLLPGGQSEEQKQLMFKVNDDQFLEFVVGETGEGGSWMEEVSLLTSSAGQARQVLLEQGMSPGEIRIGEDGAKHFQLTAEGTTRIDFVEYVPECRQVEGKGKFLSPRRVTTHLQHAGMASTEPLVSLSVFRDKFGFWETSRGGAQPGETRWINMMMPGEQGDYLELMVYEQHPPSQRQHVCFAVSNIKQTHRLLRERKLEGKFNPFLAKTGDWLMNVKAPGGIRMEFMEVK